MQSQWNVRSDKLGARSPFKTKNKDVIKHDF